MGFVKNFVHLSIYFNALFAGVASIIGTPIAGIIYEHAGSYDIPFYVAGIFFILAGFISLAAQILHRKQKRQQ